MIISPNPDTKKVAGTCKKCGEIRNDFLNYLPSTGWDNSHRRKKAGDPRKKDSKLEKSESKL